MHNSKKTNKAFEQIIKVFLLTDNVLKIVVNLSDFVC